MPQNTEKMPVIGETCWNPGFSTTVQCEHIQKLFLECHGTEIVLREMSILQTVMTR